MYHRRAVRIVPLTALLLACLAPVGRATEKDPEPIAVFAFSGYDRFVEDLTYLQELTREGEKAEPLPLVNGLVRKLTSSTNVTDLKGLDPARPMGAALFTDGLDVAPVAFMPVLDAEAFLASIKPLVGEVAVVRENLWKVGRGEVTGYVRVSEGWLFLAQAEANLARLPRPLAHLEGLTKTYDAALELNLRNIPDVFRTMAIDLLRLTLRQQLEQRREGESDAAFELRKRMTAYRFRFIEQFLIECGQITLGWSLDKGAKESTLELVLTPLAETQLAAEIATLRKCETRFGSLGGDEDPFAFHLAWQLDGRQIEKAANELAAARADLVALVGESGLAMSDAERQTLRELSGTLLDVVQATISTGRVDLALSVSGDKPPVTIAAATYVGRGDALREAFEGLQALGKSNPRFSGFELDAAKVGDVRVHAIGIAQDQKSEALHKLFGADLKLYVAFANEATWLAIGPDALAAIERGMSNQPAELPPVQATLRLGRLTELAEQTLGISPLFSAIGARLREGDDRAKLTIEAVEGRLRVRLETKEGVLRAAALGLGLMLLLG